MVKEMGCNCVYFYFEYDDEMVWWCSEMEWVNCLCWVVDEGCLLFIY